MADIVVSGNSSGSVTLRAPDVSGTTILTLPTTTGTLVVTGGAQTIEFADGTVSAPSITNSGDTNTGIFFPAADTIAFTEGGVESMRIDSSGNLGIGTTPSAFYRMTLRGNATGSNTGIYAQTAAGGGAWEIGEAGNNTTNFQVYNYQNGYMLFGTNNAERMRITSTGDVGIGTSSPAGYKLAINNGAAGDIVNITDGVAQTLRIKTGSGFVALDNPSSGALAFQVSGTERMRVNSGAPILCLAGGNTSATGTGIAFPATQSASSDANTLDDYEEGTWTPTAFGQSSAGTTTYLSRGGYYIKTGRFVFLKGSIAISAMTGTGNLRIGGLPFTQQSSDSSMGFIMTDALDLPATGNMTLYVDANTTDARIFVSTDNAAWQTVQCENGTWDMHFTFLMSASS
jgi:hypothetical protein